MDSFELNKILGAILGTCLITLALNIGAGAIFAPEKPAKPGYAIATKEPGAAEPSAAKEPEQPMEAMMASASVEKGQAAALWFQLFSFGNSGCKEGLGHHLSSSRASACRR